MGMDGIIMGSRVILGGDFNFTILVRKIWGQNASLDPFFS